MDVKAVFFDMDGTLFTSKQTISPGTVQAINQLKKVGVIIGLASGRDPKFMLTYMASLGLDCVIAYNGQYIYSRQGVLFAQALDRTSLEELVHYGQKNRIALGLGTARDLKGSGMLKLGHSKLALSIINRIPTWLVTCVRFLLNRFLRLLLPKKDLSPILQSHQDIYQVVMVIGPEEARRIQKRFPNFTYTSSSAYATDVISKGMSKSEGIRVVGKKLGFGLDQVMAFGDGKNDVEMLEKVGYSVAMGNAHKKAKAAADYQTLTNDQDGIYHALVELGLVKENKNVSE